MKQLSILFFLIVISLSGNAQEIPEDSSQEGEAGESSKRRFSGPKDKKEKPSIKLYQIISPERDTTYVDTTLSIQKEYKYNYLRKDDFEFTPFPNIGRPYVELAKQDAYFNVMPHFGARARHLVYLEAKDINYYRVPTPLTELYYKTTQEQGQQLDAFLTVNTSPNINITLAYKGIRSLGDYLNTLTSTKGFRGIISYNMPNKRYNANIHFTDQEILNQENGGISNGDLPQYLSADENFENRASFTPNYSDTESVLEGKRWYLDHAFHIIRKDSLQKNQLSVRHKLEYTTKEYSFFQPAASVDFFGEAQRVGDFRDKVALTYLTNQIGVDYSNETLGDLSFYVKQSNYNYGYDQVLIKNDIVLNAQGEEVIVVTDKINNRLSGNITALGAHYKNTYKGFLLEGNAESTIAGDYENQYFLGTAGYQYKEDIAVKFGYKLTSEIPNYNQLLYQSNFSNYNWQNDFKNVFKNTILARIESDKLLDVEASLSVIDNYTYFGKTLIDKPTLQDDNRIIDPQQVNEKIAIATPIQTSTTIGLLKVKAFREFKFFRNFRLANTLMFQQASGDAIETIYNVPKFTTRNTLYYQNEVFKKAMFLQTGINFKYYTEYYTDDYDPLLAEFVVQNQQKFGDFPTFDVFLNAKVRQTRIFLKLENAQGLLKQNTELLTGNYPTRDFLIRFGLVWNFFL